jgi:hypothetical protein
MPLCNALQKKSVMAFERGKTVVPCMRRTKLLTHHKNKQGPAPQFKF